MVERLLQPAKQSNPKLFRELGIVTEVKPVQPQKQLSPKLITELEIVIEVKPVQGDLQLFVYQ